MPALPQSAPARVGDARRQRYDSALSLLASLFFMCGSKPTNALPDHYVG